MAASQDGGSLAQRSQERLHFANADLDYYLRWIIGREATGGADRAECLATAATIPDGDVQAWQDTWARLGENTEATARAALAAGDRDAARGAFLRAATYHRAPLFVMPAQDPRFHPAVLRMQACFREAGALFDPPLEAVQVPWEGALLDGYAWCPPGPPQPRPTLLVFGGIETFAEDCWFMLGTAGTERGYTCITVDLPGQGLLPDQGLYFGAHMDRPIRALLDVVTRRPDVDPDRVAVFGFSWGGHIAFKAALDPRPAAIIADPPMPDVFRSVRSQQRGSPSDPIAMNAFRQVAWRMGLELRLAPRPIARRLKKAWEYFFHGKVDPHRLTIPVLALAGEDEPAITQRVTRELAGQLQNPASVTRVLTRAEGGAAHCQIDNLPLLHGILFGWLDPLLGARPTAEPGPGAWA